MKIGYFPHGKKNSVPISAKPRTLSTNVATSPKKPLLWRHQGGGYVWEEDLVRVRWGTGDGTKANYLEGDNPRLVIIQIKGKPSLIFIRWRKPQQIANETLEALRKVKCPLKNARADDLRENLRSCINKTISERHECCVHRELVTTFGERVVTSPKWLQLPGRSRGWPTPSHPPPLRPPGS